MEPSTTILLGIVFIGIGMSLWAFRANNKTYQERVALMDARPWDVSFQKYSEEMNAVSYSQHLWYRLTFRDPIKLYGPKTRELVGK